MMYVIYDDDKMKFKGNNLTLVDKVENAEKWADREEAQKVAIVSGNCHVVEYDENGEVLTFAVMKVVGGVKRYFSYVDRDAETYDVAWVKDLNEASIFFKEISSKEYPADNLMEARCIADMWDAQVVLTNEYDPYMK